MSAPAYPGRALQFGESDTNLVTLVQRRLLERGCGPLEVTGDFDNKTRSAVRLFQGRFPDSTGAALVVDGKVGPLTWETLFGDATVATVAAAPDALLASVLKTAAAEVGTMEEPPGSNRGPRVDQYLKAVGLDPAAGSFSWCAAFVYWCFGESAPGVGRTNPVVRTAGVMDHWRRAEQAGARRLAADDATADPSRIHPGMIFVLDTGGGFGHTGLVEAIDGGRLITVEGNTNDGGSREGVGVFRRNGRKIISINRGFIDYSGGGGGPSAAKPVQAP
jgi:CHAP domain-containing protein/putative peptidoglycan binding protein